MKIQHEPPAVGVPGGNVGGMDAAVERTGMYSQRFPEEIPTVGDDLDCN